MERFLSFPEWLYTAHRGLWEVLTWKLGVYRDILNEKTQKEKGKKEKMETNPHDKTENKKNTLDNSGGFTSGLRLKLWCGN